MVDGSWWLAGGRSLASSKRMAQLKEDEFPADREPTTHEQQVATDPINGPKDPHDTRQPTQARRDTEAAEPKGRT